MVDEIDGNIFFRNEPKTEESNLYNSEDVIKANDEIEEIQAEKL